MSGPAIPYYVELGAGVDDLVRCNACRQLVLTSRLAKHGRCVCGSGKMVEIRTLSQAEWDRIVSGELDFPHRDKFIKEFAPESEEEDGA